MDVFSKYIKVLVLVLVAFSVGLNFYLLSGHGIVINQAVDKGEYRHMSWAQLILPPFSMSGRIEWKTKVIDSFEYDGISKFLNTLPPEQALMAKVYRGSITYPVIDEGEAAPAWLRKRRIQ